MDDDQQFLIDAYSKSLSIRAARHLKLEAAPYDWVSSGEALSMAYYPYSQMLSEHAMGISNSINQLRREISALLAWDTVLNDIEDQTNKFKIIVEFVAPLATIALGLPYVIRSRFYYSTAHLCHQANRSRVPGWVDDFPLDHEVLSGTADAHGKHWRAYVKLKRALEKIAGKAFVQRTRDYRNKYNHRFSPAIELGITELVTRQSDGEGRVSYTMGHTPALKIIDIADVLNDVHCASMIAFKRYQQLVEEQLGQIRSKSTIT